MVLQSTSASACIAAAELLVCICPVCCLTQYCGTAQHALALNICMQFFQWPACWAGRNCQQIQSRSILLINICLQVARAKGGKRGRKASAETDNAEGTSAWHALHAQAVQTLQLVAQALWGGHSSQAGRHSMTSAPSQIPTRAGAGGTGMGRDGTAANIAPLSFATLLDRQAADKVGGAHNSFLSSQASPGHYILCAVTVSFAPPHCAALPCSSLSTAPYQVCSTKFSRYLPNTDLHNTDLQCRIGLALPVTCCAVGNIGKLACHTHHRNSTNAMCSCCLQLLYGALLRSYTLAATCTSEQINAMGKDVYQAYCATVIRKPMLCGVLCQTYCCLLYMVSYVLS